jgi:hypothetical protein
LAYIWILGLRVRGWRTLGKEESECLGIRSANAKYQPMLRDGLRDSKLKFIVKVEVEEE